MHADATAQQAVSAQAVSVEAVPSKRTASGAVGGREAVQAPPKRHRAIQYNPEGLKHKRVQTVKHAAAAQGAAAASKEAAREAGAAGSEGSEDEEEGGKQARCKG